MNNNSSSLLVSPEARSRGGSVEFRSDVFALALLVYAIFVGMDFNQVADKFNKGTQQGPN